MRIELNSGGLFGGSSVAEMQDHLGTLTKGSEAMLFAFNNLKRFTYNINGGVGILQDALGGIEARISVDESRAANLKQTGTQVDAFIRQVRTTDSGVAELVVQNQDAFYEVNAWARPAAEASNKSWFDEAKEWVGQKIDQIKDGINKIKEKIKEIYNTIKEKLGEYWEKFKYWWNDHTKITPIHIEDEVYDQETYDAYGGRQHGPVEDVRDGDAEAIKLYTDIIRENTGKVMSEEELKQYLDGVYDENGEATIDGLNSEGCEYTAIVNTIFEYYTHRENGAEEFERKFGFSLRDHKGRLNYNAVLVDVYSKYDDPNFGGLTDKRAEKILEAYMAEPGKDGQSSVNVNMRTNVHITKTNIDNYLRDGKQVIVSAQNVKIYKEDGSVLQNCAGAGHAMVVTGVTEDGRYIVSTWGEKAYLDPKDCGKWNGSFFEGGFVSMDFNVIEYQ
ncbi:MAG: hypothetical protein IKN55_06245 [Oscillospiraceae bacterium]|nr:hypothetical protein [Oscillospiraceae bacterium]